jgi:ABC-type multidrug transport system fused ATPase/permease subunit
VARVLDETIAGSRKRRRNRQVELPDQRQLTAACQIVLATEAAAFHKRWMIERPQDYGAQVLMRLQNGLAIPAVTYLEAMRWRGPALAAYLAAVTGTDAVIAPVAPMPAATIAGPMSATASMRGRDQRITLHPPDQLSRPAVACDSIGLHQKRLAGRHAVDRPLVRRGRAGADRRGVPARYGLSSADTESGMSNLVEIDNLSIRFTGERTVHAVNDISLALGEGEVLGLLGRTGSGKSVTRAR